MVEAVVQFDYAAQEPDELTLHKGDVITEINIIDGGWWEGTLNGKRGMFPDNFVKVKGENDSNPTGSVTHRRGGGRKCKVLFSYHPVNDDELALQVDDIVDILDEVEEGWWKGKLRNQIGVFPSNFVVEIMGDKTIQSADQTNSSSLNKKTISTEDSNKVINNSNSTEDGAQTTLISSSISTDSDVPLLPPKPVKEFCKALFPYKASNDDELTLKQGDIIALISRDVQDKGWWKGELRGLIGVFPDNFVEIITPDESVKPSKTTISTNKAVETLTKPTNIFGSANSSSASVSYKTSLETPPKSDEKTSPPGVVKKPPPPLKKPQRSPSGSNKLNISSPENTTKPISPPVSSERSLASLAANKHSNILKDSNILQPVKMFKKEENSDNVDGGVLSSSSRSYNVNYDISDENSQIDLDCVSRSAMLTHPTASRVRAPRRRPPSSGQIYLNIFVKEEEIEENSISLVNGNADSTNIELKTQNNNANTNPWLEELKISQSRKQGRTRVMIGSGSTSTSPSSAGDTVSPEPQPKPAISGVVYRNKSQFVQRPQSMLVSGKIPNSRPLTVLGSSSDSVVVTAKQWNELNDKLSKLENTVQSQQESFTKTIKELVSRLDGEHERVMKMQLEIKKLTDLMTQV